MRIAWKTALCIVWRDPSNTTDSKRMRSNKLCLRLHLHIKESSNHHHLNICAAKSQDSGYPWKEIVIPRYVGDLNVRPNTETTRKKQGNVFWLSIIPPLFKATY